MQQDVDSMLAAKGMSGTQYLTSCYEATHAPLLDYLLRAGDGIARSYMMEADETLKDAQQNEISIPDPKTPDADDEEVKGQLVDVTKDTEYENFIDKLKEKTVNKIVADVTKIINSKKEDSEMKFDPKPIADQEATTESTVSAGLNYLQAKLFKENVDTTEEMQDEMMGMAIREATLNQLDVCFAQPYCDYRNFKSRLHFDKGYVITESAVQDLIK
jgi:hypothetical protein